jgi:chromodomain-helicase-DNA-binding protein 1
MMMAVDILSDYYRMRGFPFQSLDGWINAEDLRVRAVDHYKAPESTDYAFLLSARAGGLGINLATDDKVQYLTLTGIHRTSYRQNLVRIASDKQMTLKYSDSFSRETVEEDFLERAKRERVLDHLVFSWRGRG